VTTRDQLRRLFDRVAPSYDRVRPSYPAALFDDLAELTGIGPGARVLEIGCGTGQATVSLAERGYRVHAVELGTELAALASANLARFGTATRVDVADFDRWTCTEQPFDVVFAATAFHWLDPETKFDRTADLLTETGALATVTTLHIAGGTEQFFADAQSCYRRFDPTTEPACQLPTEDQVRHDRDLGHTGRYGPPVFRRHVWSVEYTTARYLELLGTYSPNLAMSAQVRDGLLGCVGALIDGRYGGTITKRYLAELRVAHPVG
jgi:SAM-dependent methyltransferase